MIRPVAVASTRRVRVDDLAAGHVDQQGAVGHRGEEGPVDQAGGRLAQRHDHHHDVVLGQQVVQLVDAVHPVHQVVPLAGPGGDRGQRHLEAGEANARPPGRSSRSRGPGRACRPAPDGHRPGPTAPGPAPAPSPGTRAGTPASARPPARRWTRRARRRRWRGPRRAGPGAARRRTRRSAAGPGAARAASRGARAAPGSRCTAGRRPRSRRPGAARRRCPTAPPPRRRQGRPSRSTRCRAGRPQACPARYRPQWVMRSLALLAAVSLLPLGACSAAGNGAPSPTGSSASSSSSRAPGRRQPDARFRHRYRHAAPGRRVREPLPRHGAPDDSGDGGQPPQGALGTGLPPRRVRTGDVAGRGHGAARPRRRSTPVRVGTVPGVQPLGEAGLLGIAVSPRFASDHSVFVYFTAASDNRVDAHDLAGQRPSAGSGHRRRHPQGEPP